MSSPIYYICEGEGGSAFGGGTCFSLQTPPRHLKDIAAFLQRFPKINDLAWTEDGGKTVVIKRVDQQ